MQAAHEETFRKQTWSQPTHHHASLVELGTEQYLANRLLIREYQFSPPERIRTHEGFTTVIEKSSPIGLD